MPGKLVLVRHGQSTWNLENLFTGWTDVDLTAQGREEASAAGTLLRDQGFEFRQAFTSVLKRAIRTLWIVLDEMDRMWVPVERDWRLNERHYGALQGLDKAETTAKYGADQVKVWRRSYDIPPPPLAADDPRQPRFDARYPASTSARLPATESLKDTLARVEPWWRERLVPALDVRWRRARRRAWQQPARARQDARRHERRGYRGVQHPDRRADPVRAGRADCARAPRGASSATRPRSRPPPARWRTRPGKMKGTFTFTRSRKSERPLHSSGAISSSRPASGASNGNWQDSRDPRGR